MYQTDVTVIPIKLINMLFQETKIYATFLS